jgi:tetratricopeptide (TPR) repeat protein
VGYDSNPAERQGRIGILPHKGCRIAHGDLGRARDRVLVRLEQAGVAASRVEFADRQPRQEYLKLYQRIDIGLDPLPYNGHTTSLDALWMGVPIVTLVSKQTAFGRAGWSQLCNLDLKELAAESPEQYVALAARLVADLPRLQELRGTLRQRMLRSPLMDAKRFARNVEQAYRQMWHKWCQRPRPAEVNQAISQDRSSAPQASDMPSELLTPGSAVLKQGRWEEAVVRLQQFLGLNPNSAAAHLGLGVALMGLGRPAEAAVSFQEALRVDPNHAGAHSNLGVALLEQGRLEDAAASFQQAIHLKPQSAEVHTHLAMIWLLMGDFQRGWPEYEWRWRHQHASMPRLPQPAWDGSSLAGRTILLRAEQGLGDTLHFIRYAPLVKQLGATVLVECQKSLILLLTSCPGIDGLVPRGAESPQAVDVQAGLLSLPGKLGTTLETIPANVPYLFADAQRIEQWRRELSRSKGFKIGIAWQGDPKQDRPGLSRRAVPLAEFLPLGRLADVQLYSLQKGPGAEQLGQVAHLFPVIDLGSRLDQAGGAFLDTAAVMKSVDLVVTCDTAIGHLAGALGVPVWLALPFVAEWRWLRGRHDSPWYPSMRLFRQDEPGQWQGVFERMAREVTKLLTISGAADTCTR